MYKQTLAIAPHRGIGDLIICNALFRHFAERYGAVIIPVKNSYLESTSYMLRDVETIVIVPAATNNAALDVVRAFQGTGPTLLLGNKGEGYRREQFDRCFYAQAQLPFELRWSGFKFVRDVAMELQTPPTSYVFIHDDPSRGFVIDRNRIRNADLPAVLPTPSRCNNIFAWVRTILGASEIHCIDSSFALLVDSLSIEPSVRLFIHRYARLADTIPAYRHQWEILV